MPTEAAFDAISADTLAGQAAYSPRLLRSYDLIVHVVSNHLAWRCPTRELCRLYDECVSTNHLDVGVGTGYFLDRCRFPPHPRIVLMDLNEHCLAATARRIARFQPQTVRRNVLEPISFDGPAFDSIGVMYLLHCLPGTMAEKAVVFDHLQPLLAPGGKLFGATLLSEGVQKNAFARRLMDFYNQKGIFSNRADSLPALKFALESRFQDVEIRQRGCAAMFCARNRR